MEVYKILVIIFGSWILICSIMNKYRLPNFFCLDKLFGSFGSNLVKVGVFIGVIYLLCIEIWKRYINNKEGLAPGESNGSSTNNNKNPSPTRLSNNPGSNNNAISAPSKQVTDAGSTNQPAPTAQYVNPMEKLYPDLIDIPISGKIPDGYYKILIKNQPQLQKMRPIPDGCKLKVNPSDLMKGSNVDPKTGGIVPITPTGNYSEDELKCVNVIDLYKENGEFKQNSLTYDAANTDSYSSINKELRGSEKEARQVNFDVSLNLVDPYPVYYEPGSFPFASTGFIPSYEDSVYLSKSTNLSQAAPITKAPYLQGGFCTQYANDDQTRNAKCNTLSADTCASTECCVLVGGTKCVAGNAGGPTIKSVFSDVTIPNRDYWYYQGKCMGNCP
jgi:hypothetical protein